MQQPEPTDAGEGGRGGMLPRRTAPITAGLHTVGTIPWNNNNHNLPKSLSPLTHIRLHPAVVCRHCTEMEPRRVAGAAASA